MSPGAVWTLPLGEVEDVAAGTYWLRFEAPPGLACEPGHFFMLSSPASGAPFLGRPLSIGDVRDGSLRFLVRALGRGTAWFRTLPAGSLVRLVGPLGRPFAARPGPLHRIVAGGIGLAPFFYLARRLRATQPGARIELHYGERGADAHVPLAGSDAELFDAVERFTDDGSLGARGTVVAGLAGRLDDAAAWYACGPDPMLRALAGRLEQAGVSDAQFSLEERMACGFGVCQACIVPNRDGAPRYRLLCVDGPVVDPREVAW